MTTSALRQLIEVRFSSKWGSRTSIEWENVDFTPPSRTAWVSLRIVPGLADFASLGKHPLVRSAGVIEVNILTPKGSGTNPGNVLCDYALAVYRGDDGQGWSSAGLKCHAGVARGPFPEEEWIRQVVIVPFEYDESF